MALTSPDAARASAPLALRFTHHGAVRGVTGSCHQLALPDGRSVLVDCGLFQALKPRPTALARRSWR